MAGCVGVSPKRSVAAGVMARVETDRVAWICANVLPHEGALRSWLRSHRLIEADICDIVQETYAALVSLESVAHIQDARPYMFSVARNLMLRTLRGGRPLSIHAMAEIELSELESDEPSLEQQADSGRELERVAEQLEALPPQCRRAFLLRKLDGLSQAQIAAEMGISESTVEKHLGKALRMILKLCGRERHTDNSDVERPSACRDVKRA
jgi:RNA polymerase sigma factor (sigma-70 family)